MKLKIKKMNAECLDLEVDPAGTVLTLKSLVRECEGVEESRQRLIYHGRVLKDEDSLSVYNLVEDGVLHLVVRPESAPAAAAPPQASPPPAAPFPLQDLGGGVLVGTVAVDTQQNPDLGGILSQLFSTLGHGVAAAPGQPQAPTAGHASPTGGAPRTVHVNANAHIPRHIRRGVPLRNSLEQSVANAHIVADMAASAALVAHPAPANQEADLDSANDRIALAQGLSTLHSALAALQSPVAGVVTSLRSGEPQSTRERIDQNRQREQLRYMLTRLATSAVAMSNSLDRLTQSDLMSAGVGASHAATNQSTPVVPNAPTVPESPVDIDDIDIDDVDVDVDAGLSLPPMDYVNAGSSSGSAPIQGVGGGGLGFLNTLIPSVLNLAVGAFAPQFQRGFQAPPAASPAVPPTSSAGSASSADTSGSAVPTAGTPTPVSTPPPTTIDPNQSVGSGGVQSNMYQSAGGFPAVQSRAHPANSGSRTADPVRINISTNGGQGLPTVTVAGQPNRRFVHHHVVRHEGSAPTASSAPPDATGINPVAPPAHPSQGVRFVHHHHHHDPSAYSPVDRAAMAQATVVGPNGTTALPQAPIATAVVNPLLGPQSNNGLRVASHAPSGHTQSFTIGALPPGTTVQQYVIRRTPGGVVQQNTVNPMGVSSPAAAASADGGTSSGTNDRSAGGPSIP